MKFEIELEVKIQSQHKYSHYFSLCMQFLPFSQQLLDNVGNGKQSEAGQTIQNMFNNISFEWNK